MCFRIHFKLLLFVLSVKTVLGLLIYQICFYSTKHKNPQRGIFLISLLVLFYYYIYFYSHVCGMACQRTSGPQKL